MHFAFTSRRSIWSKAVASCCIWFAIFFLFLIAIPPASDYLAAARQKHKRLESIASPKIILVGGSNLAFGVDSTKLGDALQHPVANMGLRGSLGLTYMFNEVKEQIRYGDIIVLCPESKLFYENVPDDGAIILESLLTYPEGIKYVDFREFLSPQVNWANCVRQVFLDKWRIYKYKLSVLFATRLTVWPHEETYCCRSFDSKGDHVAHLNRKGSAIEPEEFCDGQGKRYDLAVRKIGEFADFCAGRGAHVVFVMPPFPAGANYYDRRKGLYDHIYTAINAVRKVDVICSQDRYIFDEKLFYDTVNHLNATGRRLRTERLVKDLGGWLTKQQASSADARQISANIAYP
jgi:hypothetical protein